MKLIRVDDIKGLISKNASVVRENAGIMEIAQAMTDNPKTRTVYVKNKEEKLVGLIPVASFVKVLFNEYIPEEYLYFDMIKPIKFNTIQSLDTVTASDIMASPLFVKSDESLQTAFQRMFSTNLKELPIVDDDMKIIGDLNILELIDVWLELNK